MENKDLGASLRDRATQAPPRAPTGLGHSVGIASADPYLSAIGGIMLAGEAEAGRKTIWPQHKRRPKWFHPEDWSVWPVLSYDDRELHIVAVASARKGALSRLIREAGQAGLSPVIVCPIGLAMAAILRKWKYVREVVGEGWEVREEWRPAQAIEARRAAQS